MLSDENCYVFRPDPVGSHRSRPILQSVKRGGREERGEFEVFLPFFAFSAPSAFKRFGLLLELAVPTAEPVTTAQRGAGSAIPDEASPSHRASSSEKTACGNPRVADLRLGPR